MHVSKLRTFETKCAYEARLLEKPTLPITERAFPVSLTNKIIIKEEPISAVYKMIDLLLEQKELLGYMDVCHSWDNYKGNEDSDGDADGDANNKRYYSDLHEKVVNLIRFSTNNHDKKDYIHYERWYNKNTDSHVIIFVRPNGNEEDVIALRDFADKLSHNPSAFESSEVQMLLNCLLSFTAKLILIGDISISKSSLVNGSINLNNRPHFLVKINNKAKTKQVEYHTLLPKIWISSKDEVISTLVYQRFLSGKQDSAIKESDKIDVFIPNALEKPHASLADVESGDSQYLIRDNAQEGTKEIKYLKLAAIEESAITYETAFSGMINRICSAAKINCEWVVFDPELRGRPWGRIAHKTKSGSGESKPKLTIIVAINKQQSSITSITETPLKNRTTKESKGKEGGDSKSSLKYEYKYSNRECIDIVLAHMKNEMFAGYDVDVVGFDDIEYGELRHDTNYIVLQDPKPSYGYWYFMDKKESKIRKEAALIKAYGGDWYKEMHLQFKNKDIAIPREWNALKILNLRESQRNKGNDARLHTDPYTALKIEQYDQGMAGKQKFVLQGIHIPKYEDIARWLIAGPRYDSDLNNDMRLEVGRGKKDVLDDLNKAGEKINIDLEMKRVLVDKELIKLYDGDGCVIDYSVYSGKYRCYYIMRPSIKGQRQDAFYASQIDITVSDLGIKITDIKLLDNDSSVRSGKKFSLPKSVIPRLYNNGFYLVDEEGNVLTSYTNLREERVLSSVPQSGRYKGQFLDEFSMNAQEHENFELGGHVTLSKNKEMPGISDQSLFIPYATMNSKTGKNSDAFSKMNKDGKKQYIGGKEWFFIKELPTGELLTYISDKDSINAEISKTTRPYNILVKNKEGETIDAATSPLACLYIETCTFHVARVNSFSGKSILSSISKIALNG